MIIVPRRNIYLPQSKFGYKRFQRGIICATAVYAPAGAPQVSFNTADNSELRFNNTCFSGIRFDIDGDEWGATETGAWTNNRGQWLDGGLSSEVWIERSVTGASLNWQDPGSGRFQMTADRLYGNQRTSAGVSTSTVTFTAWDAASGGSQLDQVTVDIISEFTV